MPHYFVIIVIVNCGYPELPPTESDSNDSVPRVVSTQYHNDQPIEGSTITFSCPPGLVLIGPNLATCMDNGEWEPVLSGLICNDSKG